MKKKNRLIVVTGGSGRFGKILREKKYSNFIFPSKKELNILRINSIEKYLKNHAKIENETEE